MKQLRYPQVAGAFYPGNKDSIEKMINEYLAPQEPVEDLNINCLIAPHAGYVYSGAIAGKAYRLLIGKQFDTVIVISPSHYDYFEGVSIFPGNYLTPLGEIETDIGFTEKLVSKNDFINISELGHSKEHALEVHLPFLQSVLKSFKLVPIVMGKQSKTGGLQLAHSIANAISENTASDKRVLIVSSSDLSHFYNAEQAKQLDSTIVDDIKSLDVEKLDADIAQKKGEACGFGPIMAGIESAKLMGATDCKITGYGTSGDINHDHSRVVGYVSAAIYKN